MAEILPGFIEPMLATTGEPFDSAEHLFEVKWDGFRAVAFADEQSTRLLSRRNRPLDRRFPELSFLDRLERGMILDGEIVALKDGRPEFHHLLGAARGGPEGTSYVVFDLLYQNFEPLLSLPLESRRERLNAVVRHAGHPRLVYSEAVQGAGRRFYEEAVRAGLEGVMAKRLGSRYHPGRRTDAWIKIKHKQQMYGVVIGFVPKAGGDFRSLVVASDAGEGVLRYVGAVGTGFSEEARAKINGFLWEHLREKPVVPCPLEARWVQPRLLLIVEFSELTPRGLMRAPVFRELAEP